MRSGVCTKSCSRSGLHFALEETRLPLRRRESGKRKLPLDTIIKLTAGLKVPPAELSAGVA